MRKLLYICLFICSYVGAQQNEIITFPENISKGKKVKYLKSKCTNKYKNKAVIYNPTNFKSFSFNGDSVLHYYNLGCDVTGMIYYVSGKSKYLTDYITNSEIPYINWLINLVYSNNGNNFIANIPYTNSFLTHRQAVDFENGNLNLINRDEFLVLLGEYVHE